MELYDLTLALILTAGGATAAAGLVKGLISIFKTLPGFGPWLQEAKAEPLVAFILSALLVIVAAASALQSDPELQANIPFYFTSFLAWYGIARLSMAIHDDLAQNPNSLTGVRLGSFDIPEDNNEPPAVAGNLVEDEGPTGPLSADQLGEDRP